jgi:hypothetical protein
MPRSVFAGFRFRLTSSPGGPLVAALRPLYRDVEELLTERAVEVDHVTVYRWVLRVEADQTTVVSRRGFEFHRDISGGRHKPDGVLVLPGHFPSMTFPVWGGTPRGTPMPRWPGWSWTSSATVPTGGEKVLVDGWWLVVGGSGGRPPRHPAPPAPSTDPTDW